MAFLTATSVPVRSAGRPAQVCRLRMAMEPLNADGKMDVKEGFDVQVGKKSPICRCWKSGKFPICDGSHTSFNEETGSKVGPIMIGTK